MLFVKTMNAKVKQVINQISIRELLFNKAAGLMLVLLIELVPSKVLL